MIMGSDQSIKYLQSFGYCVVRLPKADLRPLQLLAKQGDDLDRLGEVPSLLVAGSHIPLPPITSTPAITISGQRTGDLSIGVGISVLGNVIGALGGSKLGLDGQYKQAKSAVFEFLDVVQDQIEVIQLDRYLADADIDPYGRYVKQLLEADRLYVTTATIKSKKFAVEAKKSDGTTLALDVPVIQQMIGGSIKVSGDGSTTSKLTYEGTMPLVFGFQAVQLFYDKGRYTSFKPVEAGDVGLRGVQQVERLGTEGPFVRLRTES